MVRLAEKSPRMASSDCANARVANYSPYMIYRILRAINDVYGTVALFGFIAAFFIALAFTVIYPLVPILLIFSSIFLVVAVRLGYLALHAAERAVARRSLHRGVCPWCAGICHARQVTDKTVHACSGCSARYCSTGAQFVEHESVDSHYAAVTHE